MNLDRERMKFDHELMTVALIACLIVLGGFITGSASAAEFPPPGANRHRADLVRAARLSWGLDAPVATFAAQIHQESEWNPGAVSRVGAQGLAQFMPATAQWIGGLYPDLADRTPKNPAWSLRALTAYDRWLWDRLQAEDDCSRMAMVLSAYNGGLGWVYRDQQKAEQAGKNRRRWWSEVEQINAGRSAEAFRENRGYPVRILTRLERIYAPWGMRSCA